jgi:mono/diheme cytochrome c family protein
MSRYCLFCSFVRRPFFGLAAALVVSFFAILALVGAAPALAQDQTAPPMQSPPYDPAQVTIPQTPPMALLGQPIYQENCAPCHGEQGMGNGERAPQLPAPPTAFADPAAVWELNPGQFFHTTKFGRLQNLMPPFGLREDGGGYTDDEIWQVVSYAWSLHTTPEEISAGRELYTASCASCHGEQGQGNGPEAEGELADLSDPEYAIFRSPADWSAGWQEAHPEIGGEWSLTDQANTLEYVRTFSYYPPWESSYRPGSGVISGQVVQGTAGEPPPADLPITLEAYIGFDPIATFTSTVGSDGTFRFTDLATDPNINYLATVAAGDISYSSDFLNLSPVTPTLTSELAVYDTTDDPANVRINRSHWIVDQQPGAILGGAIYIFGNSGDRTFTGRTVEGSDVPVTVGIQTPPGATEVALDGGAIGERFVQVGDIIYDTLPLLPGESTRQIVVRYALPYADTAVDLQQQFLYPVDQLSLLVASLPGVQVDAPEVDLVGPRDMGGQEYLVYSKENFDPQMIDLKVSGLLAAGSPDPRAGAAGAGTEAAAATEGSGTSEVRETAAPLASWATWAMLALVGAGLLGGVGYALQRGTLNTKYTRAGLADLRETLLQRMAHLDDMRALGEISQSEWMRQRAYLKAQLVDVMHRIESQT